MNDTSRRLAEDQERLARDLRALVADAEQLLQHAAQGAGEGYDQARSRLQDSLKTARSHVDNLERTVVERVTEASRQADTYVREHPWESVGVGAGIGAGIGLLVGLLLGRR